ncbi:MAG: hypothetical protein K0U98_02015 [Deltaproteobacteria bacterium]|nr:hypothetical protein [Deltaproteobacteria bacterium]
MRRPTSWSARPNLALAVTAAAIVLVPYATVAMQYRRALETQAVAILGLVLLLAASGCRKGRLRQRLQEGPSLGLGILFWALAAGLGGLVGLLAGNGTSQVLGQVLSITLLPLGFLAGRWSRRDGRSREAFQKALITAVSVASMVHLIHWLLATISGPAPQRLFFANGVSVAGAAPLALLLLIGSGEQVFRSPWLRRGVLILLTAYLLGSSVRGAWLAVAFGLFSLAVLRWRYRPSAVRRWLVVAMLLAAMLAGFLRLTQWLDEPRPSILPESNPVALNLLQSSGIGFKVLPEDLAEPILAWNHDLNRKSWILSPFQLPTDRTYRLRGWIRGGSSGQGFLELVWLNQAGIKVGAMTAAAWPSEDWLAAETIGRAPAGATRGELIVTGIAATKGTWSLRKVELEDLGPAYLSPWLRQGTYLASRLGSLTQPLSGRPSDQHQNSVHFRIAESRRLISTLRSSSFGQLLLGHGLGATFQVEDEEMNYIHNFYLFLLFKLGWVGTLLVAASLFLWLGALFRGIADPRADDIQATGQRKTFPERRFCAAALAAWLAYLLWSFSSPEILDFRLAPLWGLLLALIPTFDSEKDRSHSATDVGTVPQGEVSQDTVSEDTVSEKDRAPGS